MEETKKYAGIDIKLAVGSPDEGMPDAEMYAAVEINLLPAVFVKDMKPSDAECLGRLYTETFEEHLKRKLPSDYTSSHGITYDASDFKNEKWDNALAMEIGLEYLGKAASAGGLTEKQLWDKVQEAHQETIKKLGQNPRLPRKGLI